MTLVMAGLRNSGRSLIWTMGEYGWNMTTGPAACGRAWMPWQTIFQRQAPTESRTGS